MAYLIEHIFYLKFKGLYKQTCTQSPPNKQLPKYYTLYVLATGIYTYVVEYSMFLAFSVYQFQCLCTYTYLYSTSIKNRCFLFIFLRVSAFSQFTLPTHPKVSWPVSLRCTIFCRTIFIECQIWICFKAVALINYFMLSMSKPDWNWPFCTNTYILLFYKMASSNQFSL